MKKDITLQTLADNGIFDLMPNGFNIYDYETEGECIFDILSEDYDKYIVNIIGADAEEFIPAIYVTKRSDI